jgi:hypothetical protein
MEDIELGALRFRKHPLLAYRSNHCPQNKAPRALAGLRRTLSCEGGWWVSVHTCNSHSTILFRAPATFR